MSEMLSHESLMRSIGLLAEAALPRWGLEGAALKMINHSENTTWPAAIAFTAVPGAARMNRPFQFRPPPSLGVPKRFISSPATGRRSEPFKREKG